MTKFCTNFKSIHSTYTWYNYDSSVCFCTTAMNNPFHGKHFFAYLESALSCTQFSLGLIILSCYLMKVFFLTTTSLFFFMLEGTDLIISPEMHYLFHLNVSYNTTVIYIFFTVTAVLIILVVIILCKYLLDFV